MTTTMPIDGARGERAVKSVIEFHLPVRPFSSIDAHNRAAAAMGSPLYAQATAHASYNGHHYRKYYVAEYFWAGRVVIARGDFEACLRAVIREYSRGDLGASARLMIGSDDANALGLARRAGGTGLHCATARQAYEVQTTMSNKTNSGATTQCPTFKAEWDDATQGWRIVFYREDERTVLAGEHGISTERRCRGCCDGGAEIRPRRERVALETERHVRNARRSDPGRGRSNGRHVGADSGRKEGAKDAGRARLLFRGCIREEQTGGQWAASGRQPYDSRQAQGACTAACRSKGCVTCGHRNHGEQLQIPHARRRANQTVGW